MKQFVVVDSRDGGLPQPCTTDVGGVVGTVPIAASTAESPLQSALREQGVNVRSARHDLRRSLIPTQHSDSSISRRLPVPRGAEWTARRLPLSIIVLHGERNGGRAGEVGSCHIAPKAAWTRGQVGVETIERGGGNCVYLGGMCRSDNDWDYSVTAFGD